MDGQRERDSRTLVFSQRNLSRPTWHASQYEFEDLVLDIDDASLLAPRPQAHQEVHSNARRAVNATRRRGGLPRRSPLWPAPTMTPTRVEREHDLFLGVFHHAHQLAYLHRLEGWRDRCRKAVCVLIELWTPHMRLDSDYLSLLQNFDEVYVVNPAVAPALRSLGSPEPRYLPMAVDALVLSPWPRPPDRVIDVYSYGRRSDVVHEALVDLVRRDRLTYVYDSLTDASTRDHRGHRFLLATMMQRARYFMAHTINDSAERRVRTGGDEALSTRYFEGIAGGAVLLGSRPDTPLFADAFPWDDAVLDVSYDASNIGELLRDLDAQPDRLARIRADNVRGSLLAHDWAHRWARVLDDLDLPRLPGLDERLLRLQATADVVQPAAPTSRLGSNRPDPG